MVWVGDVEVEWFEGMTILDLLNRSDDDYPYPVVRMNGTIVSRPDFDRTTVPDGTRIFPIPLVSGG